jgi:hypothetical protein
LTRVKTVAQVVAEAILHTYDVSGDDARLRQAPDSSSNWGALPVRREFEAYTIILKGGTVCQEYVLKNLGFHVQSQ